VICNESTTKLRGKRTKYSLVGIRPHRNPKQPQQTRPLLSAGWLPGIGAVHEFLPSSGGESEFIVGMVLDDPGRQIKPATLPLNDCVGVKVEIHGWSGRSRLRISLMPRSMSSANSRCSFSVMSFRASRIRLATSAPLSAGGSSASRSNTVNTSLLRERRFARALALSA